MPHVPRISITQQRDNAHNHLDKNGSHRPIRSGTIRGYGLVEIGMALLEYVTGIWACRFQMLKAGPVCPFSLCLCLCLCLSLSMCVCVCVCVCVSVCVCLCLCMCMYICLCMCISACRYRHRTINYLYSIMSACVLPCFPP